jgi:hypothetical protein
MDVQKEISLRNAISYCIANNDANTATNRIMEFIRDDREAINFIPCCTELICVDNVNYEYLTLGKKYNLGSETDNYYRIENDLGHVVDMSKVRFEKVLAN